MGVSTVVGGLRLAPAPRRTLVVKFGGTSLGTPARMRRAALRVEALARSGRPVVAVVSAMGRRTDGILAWAGQVCGGPPSRACSRAVDRALATGEELSAALLAAALGAAGVRAQALRGGEAGIEVEGPYGGARIREVRPHPLLSLLAQGVVPVVAGFQGRRPDGETATLERGGSDISAVALAGALGPAPCHIVTDVDAVYARDPRLDPGAPRFAEFTHEALVELAEAGARVVHPGAARLAHTLGVPLRVYSFRAPLGRPGGTRVHTPGGAPAAEAAGVAGVPA
jgi:aspartate kinase